VVDFVELHAGPGLRGPDEEIWVRRVTAERESISTAVDWAVGAGDADVAMRIADALARDIVQTPLIGLAEVSALVLSVPGAEHHLLYPAVAGAAAFAVYLRGETDTAIELSRRAIQAERPGSALALVGRNALVLALQYHGYVETAAAVEEWLIAGNASSEPRETAICRASAAVVRVNEKPDSFEACRSLAGEALAVAYDLGNPTAILFASFAVGFVESMRDPAAAIDWLCQSLDIADRGSMQYMATTVAGFLCRCYAAVGDAVGAGATIRRGVVSARDTGSRAMLAQILDYGGQALIGLGRDEEGATLVAAATHGRIGSRSLGGVVGTQRARTEDSARAHLGADRYSKAVAEGAAMTPQDAITYALNVVDLLTSRDDT
jgi:hypothetical protein